MGGSAGMVRTAARGLRFVIYFPLLAALLQPFDEGERMEGEVVDVATVGHEVGLAPRNG